VPKLLALAQDLEAATKLGQMGLVDGFTAAEEGTEQFWRNVAGDGAVDKVCVCAVARLVLFHCLRISWLSVFACHCIWQLLTNPLQQLLFAFTFSI